MAEWPRSVDPRAPPGEDRGIEPAACAAGVVLPELAVFLPAVITRLNAPSAASTPSSGSTEGDAIEVEGPGAVAARGTRLVPRTFKNLYEG